MEHLDQIKDLIHQTRLLLRDQALRGNSYNDSTQAHLNIALGLILEVLMEMQELELEILREAAKKAA